MTAMKLKHVISVSQFFDKKLLDKLFGLADQMRERDKEGTLPHSLAGKILACVFYEPSTRTRLSFESAMHKLGGSVISMESAGSSSAAKGESLQDSINVISGYADAIVLRHPEKGSAKAAADASSVPVLNAGDGAGEHPTQSLLDLYTIQSEVGHIDGLSIALVGDLLNGRTVHSLAQLLALYKDVKLYLISPPALRLPDEYKRYLQKNKVSFEEFADLRNALKELDVIYMTRVQKERFSSAKEYERLKDAFVISKRDVRRMKKNAIIMHPLPRNNEIHPAVDIDKRAIYFRQAKNGLYVRMALLQTILRP